MNNTQNEKMLDLKITAAEFNAIMAGLEELPHRVSRRIIDNLMQQAQAQIQTPEGPLADKIVK